jgi:branched-chain amino acid transport system substrate-binding protein
MHMFTRTVVAVVAALVAATAVGCGGSKGEKSSATAAAKPAATAAPRANVSGDPIVVGSICSCSGLFAAFLGRTPDVLKAWEQHTNGTGGINGHPVKVITVDDANNPAKGLAGVKKLIETDKVVAIVGQESLTSATWEKYVAAKGVPVLGGQPIDKPFMTNPDFFASGTTLPVTLFGELSMTKAAGKKKLGLFYCAEAPVCALLEPILAGLGKQLGLEVEGAKVSSTAPSYAAPCLAFKQKGVDALFAALNSDLVPRVVDACAQQGYRPLSVASTPTTQRSWLGDDNLDGSLIAGTNALYTDTSVPGVKTFIGALDQYVPGLTKDPQFNAPLLYPWAGGELFAAAAAKAKLTPSSTPADVKRGLYALKDETLDGISPPLNFVKGKPAFPTCYFPQRIEGGQFKASGGGEPVCLDAKTAGAIAAALGG